MKPADIIDRIIPDWNRFRKSPSIAVVGPRGCGKTAWADGLCSTIKERGFIFIPVKVDLRRLPLDSEEQMRANLIHLLWKQFDLSTPSDLSAPRDRSSFHAAIAELSATQDPKTLILIIIDHLDSVPRYFARSIARSIRAGQEQMRKEFRQIGFIVTGALSLFELKQEVDSAFTNFEVVKLPQYLLTPADIPFPIAPEHLTQLEAQTGGEKPFLDALISHLLVSGTINDEADIANAVETLICRLDTLPTLRDIALSVWGDRSLYEFTIDLLERKELLPRGPVVDITKVELAGVAKQQSDKFRFRNGIVAAFLSRLVREMSTINYHVDLTHLLERHATRIQQFPILADLLRLSSARAKFFYAADFNDVVDALRIGWELTTTHGNATLHFALQNADSFNWITTQNEPSGRGELVAHAAELCRDIRKVVFTSDRTRVAVATPICAEPHISIISCVGRAQVVGEFAEVSLQHWTAFVEGVKSSVTQAILSEIGRNALRTQLSGATRKSVSLEPDTEAHSVLLMSSPGVLVKGVGIAGFLKGALDSRAVEDLNNRVQRLSDARTGRQFEEEIEGIGDRTREALSTIDGLPAFLRTDTSDRPIMISGDADSLKIPFELVPKLDSYLALHNPVIRRLLPSERLIGSSNCEHSAGNDKIVAVVVEADAELEEVATEAEEICRLLTKASEARGCRLELYQLRPHDVSPSSVEMALTKHGNIDFFHFCGHSEHIRAVPDDSGLILRSTGTLEVISTRALRRQLGKSRPWLTYFSSCETATVAGGNGISSRYSGLVEAAVSAGVHNIVAFRGKVSDFGAKKLAVRFYSSLFTGKSMNIGSALLEARQVADADGNSRDSAALAMFITQCSELIRIGDIR